MFDINITNWKIASLGIGLHNCGFNNGYVRIKKKDNKFNVLYLNGKHEHDLLKGPPVAIDYSNTGASNICVMPSKWHNIIDTFEQSVYILFMDKKITKAYNKKFNR